MTSLSIHRNTATPLKMSAKFSRKLLPPQPGLMARVGRVYKNSAINVLSGLALWGGTAAVVAEAYQAIKPFALALLYRDKMLPINVGDSPGKYGSAYADHVRRARLNNFVVHQYLQKGDGKIDWPEVADIADFAAQNAHSDYDFRRDIWYLFGWRNTPQGEKRAPFAAYLDATNQGLPPKLFNRSFKGLWKHEEQMHHYLGGVVGNNDVIPSHLWLNPFTAFFYECRDFVKKGTFNLGDVLLFLRAMPDRDDYLKHGRFVVGRNIRKLIQPAEAPASPKAVTSALIINPSYAPGPTTAPIRVDQP